MISRSRRASQPVTTISGSWNAEASITGRNFCHVPGRKASAEKWNTTRVLRVLGASAREFPTKSGLFLTIQYGIAANRRVSTRTLTLPAIELQLAVTTHEC
jgi:hypothetical protein